MLGWHISVYRQQNDGASPASFGAGHGARVAVWQTGLGGLDWIRELVTRGLALDLGHEVLAVEYTAQVAQLAPILLAGPPGARVAWAADPGDILSPHWAGRTVVDVATLEACRPDEWLLIQAWDES